MGLFGVLYQWCRRGETSCLLVINNNNYYYYDYDWSIGNIPLSCNPGERPSIELRIVRSIYRSDLSSLSRGSFGFVSVGLLSIIGVSALAECPLNRFGPAKFRISSVCSSLPLLHLLFFPLVRTQFCLAARLERSYVECLWSLLGGFLFLSVSDCACFWCNSMTHAPSQPRYR